MQTLNTLVDAGSSPRVRSRPVESGILGQELGIISACAEQTTAPPFRLSIHQDHLRVCGADTFAASAAGLIMGSSPRVRSRQGTDRHRQRRVGIISACAEQTAGRRGD